MTTTSRADAKRCYEFVEEAAVQQTGGSGTRLPPAVSERGLRTVVCSHGGVPVGRYERALEAARSNGDVVAGSGYVAPSSPLEQVRAAIPYVAARSESPQAFVAAANEVLA